MGSLFFHVVSETEALAHIETDSSRQDGSFDAIQTIARGTNHPFQLPL
jgi:hypothetical protein